MTLYYIIGGFILIAILKYFFQKPSPKNTNSDSEKFPYRKKYLFTKSEYNFYWKIKPLVDYHKGTIFCKMRLADIIDVIANKSEYHKYFNKIKSKHIDFIICDEKLNVKALIELDDPTHKKRHRQKRDEFINNALDAADIKILHITNAYENMDYNINSIFEGYKIST